MFSRNAVPMLAARLGMRLGGRGVGKGRPARVSVCAVVAGAMAVLCSASVAAGPTSGWSIQTLASPVVLNEQLSAVSCASRTACVAVGSGAGVSVAERWNGRRWSLQRTVASQGALSGVSCTARTFCAAVGTAGGRGKPLAERWNGRGWSRERTPRGLLGSLLNGVSCVSRTACIAVGGSSGVGVSVAERWNGRRWSLQRIHLPGFNGSQLADVACTSVRACIAVGSYTNDSDTSEAVAARWNGRSWSDQRVARRRAWSDNALGSVSCTSATRCVALGHFYICRHYVCTSFPLVELWNGVTWSIRRIAKPRRARSVGLNGVSCTTGGVCVAVGSYTNHAGRQTPLVERWSGAKWSVERSAEPAGSTGSVLTGVSCVAGTACTAVGGFVNAAGDHLTLAEHRLHERWMLRPTPNVTSQTQSQLDDVSCSSDSACTSVGFADNALTLPLVERWNGISWSIQPALAPSDTTGATLTGISCTSEVACVAVGAVQGPQGKDGASPITRTLAESWNGSSWRIESTPKISGSTHAELDKVSCTSDTACTAVGWYVSSTDTAEALAERWNGISWAIQNPPDPGAEGTKLNAVSCPTGSACTAVGSVTNLQGNREFEETLVEHWDGVSWTVQDSPTSGAANTLLGGISCPSPTACTAVGNDQSGTALAEHWNGITWTIQETPNPSGTSSSALSEVSCTSQGACTAVGSVNNEQTLVEQGNGANWTIQATPNPSGAFRSVLSAVACPSETVCAAVGEQDYDTDQSAALADHYS